MDKPTIIVESPTKVKTIKKYTGNKYNVTATSGHLRDLPPSELGIDIDNNFQPKYTNIKGKQKVITSLKKAVGDATDIYLAPDPDREGEAIAFHTAEILKKKERRFHRILFHELTKSGIENGLSQPHELDQNKYEAQQARRILDRLVGYQISPLLWRKVQSGLSAGRVQSVAVRIICDREREIFAFEPEEYWSITATLEGAQPPQFTARLTKKEGKKIKIGDETAATNAVKEISENRFVVDKITKKTVKRNPQPPFITSKLQQEAIKKLGFSAKKTMTVAQQLYEGVDLGPGEPEGLITYMRTDSTRIAAESAHEALAHIRTVFGDDYALDKPRFFANKNKAQDAHEAIRPTSVSNTPESIKKYLSKDQFLLYELIWKRFVASQMSQALIDQKTIAISAGDYLFTASGSTVKFSGFMSLYQTADDKNGVAKKEELPELTESEILKMLALDPKQHFTAPPPRFSEASLVKELEENGIGRPSTYATILSTIRDKGYVDLVNKYFRPTELGFIVTDLLVENFPNVLNIEFTANLENDLDRVESDQMNALKLLSGFYEPFSDKLESAKENMLSLKGVGVETGLKCPSCGKDLRIKIGRNGQFLACSGYPDCTYSRNYTRTEKGEIQAVEPDHTVAEGKTCDKCGSPMVVKQGRYGDFLACSAYPACKSTQSLNSGGNAKPTGIKCPEKGCDGEIVEKTSKRGKVFYGCNNFPECKFATWDKPVDMPCPQCNAPFVVEKTTKKSGTFLKCIAPDCDFQQKT
ncbi:MAG: type I DNA topoisomerase [Thermodesulfobacteriota bacterium]|nr:type I DNA topoisomerase [Thermodesulfobacteriota bacterium]